MVADYSMNRSTLILLAGGLASRLGGDKALYPIGGKPMIEHIIGRVSGVSDEAIVVIARNRSRSQYSQVLPEFIKVVNDETEWKSPLVGIVAGLRAAKSEYAIVLSCDIPFVSRQVIRLLLRRAVDADAAVPRSRTGHLEPLQAVYRREDTLHKAQEALAKGQLSPIGVIHNLPAVVYVSIENEIRVLDHDLRTFFNVNTKADVAKAEMILKQEDHDDPRIGRTARSLMSDEYDTQAR